MILLSLGSSVGEKSLQFNWSSNEHHENEGHHLISLDPDHQDIHRSSYNNTLEIAKPFSTLPFCYRISIIWPMHST